MTKRFFRLKSDVYLAKGEPKSALYDGGHQRVFLLEEDRMRALDLAEKNIPLEAVADELHIAVNEVVAWMNELQAEGLGDYLAAPAFVEKVNYFPRWQTKYVFQTPPVITTGFLVVAAPCNLNCSYCDSQELDLHLSCWRCVKGEGLRERGIKNLVRVIRKYWNLGVQKLCITTPPTVDIMSILMPLVAEAEKYEFKPEIISDISIVMNSGYRALKNRVNLLLKVDVERYPIPTFVEAISKIPAESCLLLVGDESRLLEDFKSILGDLRIDWLETSVIMPRSFHVPHRLSSPLPDTKTLNRRQRMHSCLGSTLAVHSDGIVSTCPMLRTHSLASEFDIVRALQSDDFLRQRSLAMDTIFPCASCGLRYACTDCRYIDLRAGAEIDQCVTCDRLDGSNAVGS